MKTKLSEFYSHRDALMKNEEPSVMNQLAWNAMEEELIREEVLPEVIEHLVPVLNRVKSPLSLHVDYTPDGNLSVSFTRNAASVSLAQLNGEIVEAEEKAAETEEGVAEEQLSDDTTEEDHHEGDLEEASIAETAKPTSRTKIRVTTPEGKVFFNNVVWYTLRDVVLYAGYGRVMGLNQSEAGVPLVCDHLVDNKYAKAQHEIAPGIYLFTNTSTPTKIREIQEINTKLGLNLKLETV